MDLELNEYQKMLQGSAKDFFAKEFPLTKVRTVLESETGLSPELWKKMAELGWLGIMIPEQFGGMGGEFMDMAVVLAEMGRAFVPSPYLETMVLGALPILELGTEAQKQAYLPAIARGEMVFGFGIVEEDGLYHPGSIKTRLARNKAGIMLNGTKLFVRYSRAAQNLLCVAVDRRGFALVVVDMAAPGVSIKPLTTMTQEFYTEVTFSQVPVSPENILATFPDWSAVNLLIDRAAVALCAQAVGLGEHVLDITVEYAKTRVQFRRPIGSFQAIQHHAANMLLELDGCRLLTYEAASRISRGAPYSREASMAKSWVNQGLKKVIGWSHQIHGGVGFIEEHELPLYYRHAWASASLFGDTDYHGENVTADLVKTGRLF